MPTPDRHRDDYDPEPDYERPTKAEAQADADLDERMAAAEAKEIIQEIMEEIAADPSAATVQRAKKIGRPICVGCGMIVVTETEALTYDGDGLPWHEHCFDGSEDEREHDG